MSEQTKPIKTPQTVHKIENFLHQIRKALRTFDESDFCYGAANKVVKQDLEWKNGKDLDNICIYEVLVNDANLFVKK